MQPIRARLLPRRIPTWTVDPRRTRVTFTVCLLGLSMAEGTFHEVSGVCRFDPDRPSSSATGTARIAVASLVATRVDLAIEAELREAVDGELVA